MSQIKRVFIPVKSSAGDSIMVIPLNLVWCCPICRGPRGNADHNELSFGDHNLSDWVNPCGHTELFAHIMTEAFESGLNKGIHRV